MWRRRHPMDCAASMRPGSTSRRDTSAIRAKNGVALTASGTIAAQTPIVVPTTSRVKGISATSSTMKGTARKPFTTRPTRRLARGAGRSRPVRSDEEQRQRDAREDRDSRRDADHEQRIERRLPEAINHLRRHSRSLRHPVRWPSTGLPRPSPPRRRASGRPHAPDALDARLQEVHRSARRRDEGREVGRRRAGIGDPQDGPSRPVPDAASAARPDRPARRG